MSYSDATAVFATEFGPQVRRVTLEKQSEIRIQVPQISPLKLRVLHGKVEIFGSELPRNVWLTFPPLQQFAIFAWYGATLEIDSVTKTDTISDETPMMSYLNVHNSLQVQRHRVTSSTRDYVSSQGPRVIIIGDTDSGKSTLAKMLLSWAAKDGCKPTFVDLNIGQSSITIPGTIAATSVEMPMDPVEGLPLHKALVHYFGHTTPTNNIRLYKYLVEELARELDEEFARNAESRRSGMVIDTMGWTNGLGYQLLLHAIKTFNASLVIVLGQQETELVYDLNKAFKFKKNVQILNLQRSSGVFSRNSFYICLIKAKGFCFSYSQKYFNGATNNLTAYTKTAKFSDMQVYRIGDLIEKSNSTKAVLIDKDLVNTVLAISYAKQPHHIISSIVAGFVYVTDVDLGEEKITYLSPSIAELPSKIFIMGTLTWHQT
ncbi:hypothetical protein Bca52824_027741 [Brassica carinata]|uniref:Protein CLP1 homolog n=1 Tax=Brassica carinata TaxID=52824 RepID=A0A8X7VB30_BRACI|nr:hypothetical protein Bca52824_027741 [Brassica carinata]